VTAIGHVVSLAKVDGVLVVLAVRWVVAHWLPAMTVPAAPTERHRCIVFTIVASVLHLFEGVHTSGHTIPVCEPHIVEGAGMVGSTIVEGIPVPGTNHTSTHVEAGLSSSLPLVAVAMSAKIAVLATVVASVVAHTITPELVLVNEETVGHVVVVPVMAVGHVVRLTNVDGVPVVLAVRWVVAHWLPAMTIPGTALPGSKRVITTMVACVLHLTEVVDASRHAVLSTYADVVP